MQAGQCDNQMGIKFWGWCATSMSSIGGDGEFSGDNEAKLTPLESQQRLTQLTQHATHEGKTK
jgi:hypothetical protein